MIGRETDLVIEESENGLAAEIEKEDVPDQRRDPTEIGILYYFIILFFLYIIYTW